MLHVTLIKYCQTSLYMQNRCIVSYFYLHRVPLVAVSLPCPSDHFFSTPLPSSFWCASLVWSLISQSCYLLTLMYGVFLLFPSTIQEVQWFTKLHTIVFEGLCTHKDIHQYTGFILVSVNEINIDITGLLQQSHSAVVQWRRKVFKKTRYYLPSHHSD